MTYYHSSRRHPGAAAPPFSRASRPYVEDALGTQRLVGIDSSNPMDTLDLVGSMGNSQLSSSTVPDFLASVNELYLDSDHGLIYERGPETLYFIAADGLQSVDLLVRLNASGQASPREAELLDADAVAGEELQASPLLGQYKALLSYRDTITGARVVVEIRRDGSTIRTVLGPAGEGRGIIHRSSAYFHGRWISIGQAFARPTLRDDLDVTSHCARCSIDVRRDFSVGEPFELEESDLPELGFEPA